MTIFKMVKPKINKPCIGMIFVVSLYIQFKPIIFYARPIENIKKH